jgi:hypothetical protein
MTRELSLRCLGISALVITLAYLSAFLPQGAPAWAPWVFVVGMSLMLVSTMALGAAKHGQPGGPALPFFAVLFLLLAAFGGALALPAEEGPASQVILGLPLRAALVLYGVGILPVILMPILYARTFDRWVLRPGDVEAVCDAARRARGPVGEGE